MPYTVDYSLPIVERTRIVRDYYETTYADAGELFSAFCMDEVAPVYLGDLYKALYDYFYAGLPKN